MQKLSIVFMGKFENSFIDLNLLSIKSTMEIADKIYIFL